VRLTIYSNLMPIAAVFLFLMGLQCHLILRFVFLELTVSSEEPCVNLPLPSQNNIHAPSGI